MDKKQQKYFVGHIWKSLNTVNRTLVDKKTAYNRTYTQAGLSCFLGQESAKFEVQLFVGSSVLKIPACV
jgi:hypothetical protein